jgi:uncharacterized SAM-binding protein YcdF (DUF218 family)
MSFILSKLFWAVARPGNLLLLIAVIGLLLVWLRRRGGHALLATGIGGLLAVALLPVDQWLIEPLEQRFQRPAIAPARVDGIIVLGGAVDPFLTADHAQPALGAAAERMTEFVALARLHPEARLIFSGGVGSLRPGRLTEADAARMLFDSLGLAGRGVLYEGRSRNTWENALESRTIAAPKPGETWLLVTSAAHMPRSVGIFRRVGWPVVPWPVDYQAGDRDARIFDAVLVNHLAVLEKAVNEWIGLVAYRLMDRTDTLFPAP